MLDWVMTSFGGKSAAIWGGGGGVMTSFGGKSDSGLGGGGSFQGTLCSVRNSLLSVL